MNGPATHFAPVPAKLSRVAEAGVPTVVSIAALAGVSAYVRQQFGETVLQHANRAAMLDIELIEDQDCFIPHSTMTSFLDEVERRAGAQHLGLLLAPHLSVKRYGSWGEYILGGETLLGALQRAMSTLGYHSRGDRMELSFHRGVGRASYFNGGRGRPGYAHVSSATAGVMLNFFQIYTSANWRPLMIELDIPRPRSTTTFEDVFLCPVTFDAQAVSINFDARLVDQRAMQRPSLRRLTVQDLARARIDPKSLKDYRGVVLSQIWTQVLSGEISIESTAWALNTSVRTLQRALYREGDDFRELVNSVRVQRAKELLQETTASVTDIAFELGYSAPANFARAFRKGTGLSPTTYRVRK